MPRYPLLILALLLLLPGCAGYVQKADYQPGRKVPFDAAPAPLLFREVELLLPPGTDVGFESNGSRFCGWPRYPVSRTVLRDALDSKFLKQTFHDALESQGYDVVGSLDLAYDLDDENDRAEYSVTAKVRDVEMEVCHQEPDNFMVFFTTRKGDEGEFYMNVEWTVYDALRRTVVYKTKTEGYTKRRTPNQEGLTLMFTDAFDMAAHNLGADKDFYGLIVNGIKPENWKKQKLSGQVAAATVPPPATAATQEDLAIAAPPLSREPFTRNIDSKRKVAVMVQKFGHGSGFFISRDGYILTNAHNVGDGERTRIVTACKQDKLVADVIRVDKVRDVALLKLTDMPPDMKITTLPLRTDWPAVGETVYAVGTPKDYRNMQDTITKGIVSAWRKDMKFGGVKQNFLQADVETHKGSDGGPLIDENGNIVGLAVGAAAGPDGIGIGLNYFIPLAEALQALDVQLKDANDDPLALTK